MALPGSPFSTESTLWGRFRSEMLNSGLPFSRASSSCSTPPARASAWSITKSPMLWIVPAADGNSDPSRDSATEAILLRVAASPLWLGMPMSTARSPALIVAMNHSTHRRPSACVTRLASSQDGAPPLRK